jgi:hypothetical protein
MNFLMILLASGWILLLPPDKKDLSELPDGKEPLKEWLYSEAFDSAKECEAAKQDMIKRAQAKSKGAPPADLLKRGSPSRFTLIAIAARCVPSDALDSVLK